MGNIQKRISILNEMYKDKVDVTSKRYLIMRKEPSVTTYPKKGLIS